MRSLPAVLATALLLAGCLHESDGLVESDLQTGLVGANETLEKIEAVTAKKPLKFRFPGQAALPSFTLWINGTIGPDAATSYEFPGNRGGTSYNTLVVAEDVSKYVPVGQPTQIDLRLWWSNGPGRGAKLDPYIEVPGTLTHENRGYQDEWTWTLPVKNASVVTVGVPGEPTKLGVQIANAKILPGQEVRYTLRAEFRYARDVITPYTPWAIDIPPNATGLILSSVKFAGDVHVAAKVLVIDPQDNLLAFLDYNDLAIPTESQFVPLRGPGTYVLYAVSMANGFLDLRTDAGLDQPDARPLARVESETVLVQDPVAPGVAGHVVNGVNATQPQGGVEVAFKTGPTFPLEVLPVLVGAQAVVVDADLVVEAAGKLVSRYHRFLRYDDEKGRIGVSDETAFGNRVFQPGNLVKGDMTLRAVVDGSTAKPGVFVLTYAR